MKIEQRCTSAVEPSRPSFEDQVGKVYKNTDGRYIMFVKCPDNCYGMWIDLESSAQHRGKVAIKTEFSPYRMTLCPNARIVIE